MKTENKTFENGLNCSILTLQRMLAVYLAPFIHGKRYTSFGRHFTKKDKLDKVSGLLYLWL